MSSESTGSVSVEKLAEKVDHLEGTRDQAMGALTVVRWLAGSSMALSLLTAVWAFAELRKDVALMGEKVSNAEKNHAADVARLQALIGSEAARIEKSVDKIEAKLTRQFVEYKTTGYAGSESFHDHIGTIGSVSDESIVLASEEGQVKREETYPIAKGARVIVKGETGKISDLKRGMLVRLVHHYGGKVQLIETIDEPDPATKPAAISPIPMSVPPK